MPATEAQIRANKENAKKSTGPVTEEGKNASRANAVKHGLTATVVLPEREAAEVKRRSASFATELNATGDVGKALALHAARMSVRMERCAERENVLMTDRVRQALDDHEVPEGLSPAETSQLIEKVSHRASFDDSKDAVLARKYEAAAERGFFRALKELRILDEKREEIEEILLEHEHDREDDRESGSFSPEEVDDEEFERFEAEFAGSGSFSPGDMTDEEFDRLEAEYDASPDPTPARRTKFDPLAELGDGVDVPIAVGQSR